MRKLACFVDNAAYECVGFVGEAPSLAPVGEVTQCDRQWRERTLDVEERRMHG